MKKKKELFRLISAQHDGHFDDVACERLAQLLKGDEDAQRYYLELGNMFHELEETYHGHNAEVIIHEFPQSRSKVIPAVGWVAAIAATLVVAFLLSPRSGTKSSELLVDMDATILMNEERPVMRVIASADTVWGRENTADIQAGELKHGLLDLRSGSLDVVMDNGVRFGFNGPVKMDLTSMQRLALYTGNVIIDVPGIAEGVAINTPDAVITANTALAQIQYAADDSTVLMVERGAVNVFTENGNGREVRKNVVGKESVKIASGTSDPVVNTRRVTEPGIDLLQPADLENLRFAHYSFDNVRGNIIKNTGNIPGGDGVVSGLKDHPEFPGPRQVPGRFGRAVEFSGHGEGMIADLTEFGVDEPGSVAFWIKMDPNVVPGQFENIFSWHMYTEPEKSWHADDEKELACRIRINHSASEGVVGAVRVEFRNKWICGTTDLRDGRWHHVTAVFYRGYNGTTVRHYIDGQLARSSARGQTWFPRERYPEIGGGSIAVGRVYWPNRPKILAENDPVGLHGMVDELYVFNQAVLPSHAASLFMKNTPNQSETVSGIPGGQTPLAMLPFAFSTIQ